MKWMSGLEFRLSAGLWRTAWFLAIPLAAGCSMQQFVINRVGDALASGGTVYAQDDDPELVAAATPFGLKLTESLLAESPNHRGLLLAAARGFTQYAYAYVELPADLIEERDVAAAYAARDRARRLYLRARDYGLRGLSANHPGFAARLQSDPDAAVTSVGQDDVALLYWTAAAWGAAISLGKNDPTLLADLPRMERLAGRALELDEAYGSGSLQVLHISLAMSQPWPQSRRLDAARQHFDRAVQLSHGQQAAVFVTYAEAVAIATGKRDEFERLMDLALRVDADAVPEARLVNALFQRRARWLRSHADQFFSQ